MAREEAMNRQGWSNGRWMAWWVAGILAVLGTARGVLAAAQETPAPQEGVEFLSGFSGGGWLGFFGNQGDAVQKERYRGEGGMALDFHLVSWNERWAVRSAFGLAADLGKSVTEELPFAPMETQYEIRPFVEYRRGVWLARAGWAHACQHLIYKDDESPWYLNVGSNIPPDVYYNRLFVGAGRAEMRPEILRAAYFGREGKPVPARVLGYAEAGGYLRSLPGMDGESLYGGNEWVGDLLGELRVLVWAGRKWLLWANSRTQVLMDTEEELYWRERVELEAMFDSRGYGASVYTGMYVLDEHPRDSHEDLVEAGVRFTF